MFNLPKIQSLVAPLSAPIPSAVSIAAEAYNFITPQTHWFWGWFGAIAAFIGIETVGGASCYALVKLHRQRNYGVEFIISLVGILVYIGSGIFTLWNSPTIIFFFLAPFAYFAYSILRSMEKEIEEKVTETEAQIRLLDAQTRKEVEVKKLELAQQKEQTKQIKLQSMPALASISQLEPARANEDIRTCQQCGATFMGAAAMNAHMRKHNIKPDDISNEEWKKITFAVRNANKRAELYATSGYLFPHDWLKVVKFYSPDGKCIGCNQVKSLTLDHVELLTQGGSNTIGNTQPICKSCNSSKSGKLDFRPDMGKFALSLEK